MQITTTDALGLYTRILSDVYQERISPLSFLRSFFREDIVPSLLISIEVQRTKEQVAVDVIRGSDGNRNEFTRTTEKLFKPPYFREYFDATDLELYDRLYGATTIDDAIFARLVNDIANKYGQLQDKIDRRIELYCAQVLQTGILQLKNGTNIDFKRKAASMFDPGAGNYFANNVDPFILFQNGGNFLRKVGKSRGGTLDAIFGDTAWTDFLANTKFTARQNLFNMALDAVTTPQKDATGQVLMGYITAGPYRIRLWTYTEFYDDPDTGVSTSYVDPKNVIILPENPRFVCSYAAVPQLISPNTPPMVGKYILSDYVDEKLKTHEYHIESAPVPVPTAVDQIYTFKAVA